MGTFYKIILTLTTSLATSNYEKREIVPLRMEENPSLFY